MLLHTTASYKELVDKESRLAADLALAQAQLFPLKKENSRLTRENHQLHVDNIRQTDQAASMFSEQTVAMKRLQDDMVELNHVVKLKEEQYKRLEAEKERIREAYEELADPAIKSKNVRRVIKMSSPLPRAGKAAPPHAVLSVQEGPPMEPSIIDTLRRQLEEAHVALRKGAAEIQRLQNSVNAREMELARSTHAADLADGSSNGRSEQLFAADVANKRIIDQLNGQVDFLNEQLALRESQLVDSADKILRADEMQVELNQKTTSLEKARAQNAELAAQLRAMEFKFAELSEAVDPDGSVSVDEFFELSSQNDSRSVTDNHHAPPPSSVQALSSDRASVSRFRETVDYVPSSHAQTSTVVSSTSRQTGSGTGLLSTSGAAGLRERKSAKADIVLEKTLQTSRNRHHESTRQGSSQLQLGREVSRQTSSVASDVENDNVVLKLAEEKSGLLGEVFRLNEKLTELQGGDSLIKERMRRGEEKIATLKLELNESHKQLQVAVSSLSQKDEDLESIKMKYAHVENKLTDALSRLGSNASSTAELQSRASETRGILVDALREKKEKEVMVEALRSEISKLRSDHAEYATGKETAETRSRAAEKELQHAKQIAEKSVAELTEAKTEVVRLGLCVDTLESDVQILRKKVEAEKQVALAAQEQLEIKTGELFEVSQKHSLLQMSTAPSGINDNLRSELKSKALMCSELEADKRVLIQEKRLLEQHMQSLASQSHTESQKSASSESDRLQLMADLARCEGEVASLHRENQRNVLELDQTKALLQANEKTCNSLRERAMERESHFMARGETSEALSSEIQLLTRRLQDLQEAHATARYQLGVNNDSLIRNTDRLGNAEREVASLTELLASNKRDYEKLELHCSGLQRQLDMTTKRTNAERDELRRAVSEKETLEAKIQELKALVANMESTTRSQTLKSTRLAAALEEGGEGMRHMDMEIKNLREGIADRDNRLSQAQVALQSLDEERDRLQLELDCEQEQAIAKEQTRLQQESRILQIRQVLERTEKKLVVVNNELTATQRHCAVTETRLNSLKEENTELRRQINQKAAEVGGAAEDLMLMTKENQALTSELADTSTERDRLRNRTAELMQAIASLEQARRAVEIERADLLESYRSILNEKRRLENDLSALGVVKQRAGVNVQQLHSQIAELKGSVNSHSDNEQRFAMERTALTKQVETLNDEIVRSQKRLEAVEADNRRMMQVRRCPTYY